MVGLSNVDNTSDINKPVSTLQQTALNLKANLASPSFTGIVTASTIASTVGTDLNITGSSGVVKINASTYTMFGGGTALIHNSGDVIAKSFTENSGKTVINSTGIVSTGSTNLNTLDVSGNVNMNGYSKLKYLGYYGQMGAQLVDGSSLYSLGMPVDNSIPDLTNFFSRETTNASGAVIGYGSISTGVINMSDRDDAWLIMPGFQLKVYSDINYSGLILDIRNVGSVPFFGVPTVLNNASSCKLFYNFVEIV
jgi:hypothetical protein